MPDLEAIARFAGDELKDISYEAFKAESDPVSRSKWAAIKPRGKTAGHPVTTSPILQDAGHLFGSLNYEAFGEEL
jgi:hypothetical protein